MEADDVDNIIKRTVAEAKLKTITVPGATIESDPVVLPPVLLTKKKKKKKKKKELPPILPDDLSLTFKDLQSSSSPEVLSPEPLPQFSVLPPIQTNKAIISPEKVETLALPETSKPSSSASSIREIPAVQEPRKSQEIPEVKIAQEYKSAI